MTGFFYRTNSPASFDERLFLLINALYVCAQAHELLNEIIIASVDVMNVADLRLAFGNESRQNYRGTRAEVVDVHK